MKEKEGKHRMRNSGVMIGEWEVSRLGEKGGQEEPCSQKYA